MTVGNTVIYRTARSGYMDERIRQNGGGAKVVERPAIVLQAFGPPDPENPPALNLRVFADGESRDDEWRCSVQHQSRAGEDCSAYRLLHELPGD